MPHSTTRRIGPCLTDLANALTTSSARSAGRGRITERNIDDTLRQIRRSLLEADVNFKVAKDFIQRVKEQALGQNVLKSLTPGQQLVKIVHSELVVLLGATTARSISPSTLPPSSCSSACRAVARRLWLPS